MEPETRTEVAYHQLRADILSGHLAPGSSLQFAELRQNYGASMGVLREALTRLSAEGLAISRAQQGFRVVELSLKDLSDLTESRVLVETAVLRQAIEVGDLEWESQIVAAHHRMERTQKHIDGDENSVTDAWAKAHQSFHMALISAAKNTRLMKLAESLRVAAELYRRWSMPHEIVKRDVLAEHRALMELSLSRNADAACEALADHLSYTRDLILQGSKGAIQ